MRELRAGAAHSASAPLRPWLPPCTGTRATTLRRWLRVLAHPVTVAALAVWIANDVALKGSWPALVTGKVGDFASLVVLVPMAAAAIALIVPARWLAATPHLAAAAVTVAFTVLNISDAAARWWSDTLSDVVVSSRWWADPTDLLALPVVLVPLKLWQRADAAPAAWPERLAQTTLLLVASAASLATSCASDPFISAVSAAGGEVWVASGDNWGVLDYAVSRDAGYSWEAARPPESVRRGLDKASRTLVAPHRNDRSSSADPAVSCPDDDTCWRAAGDGELHRSTDGGATWAAVWEVPADERAEIAAAEEVGCLGKTPIGVSGVARVDERVVGALGARGVLVGDGETFEVRSVPPLGVYPADDEPLRWWWEDSLLPPIVGIGLTLLAIAVAAGTLLVVLLQVLNRLSRHFRA